jgi:hypothetical protein
MAGFWRKAWFVATDRPYEDLAHHYPARRGICGFAMGTREAAALGQPQRGLRQGEILDDDEGILPQHQAWAEERNSRA